MYLNRFSEDLSGLDMTGLDEFESLRQSARDLGIDHPAEVRYQSRNVVFRHQRFHFLEWGDPGAQPVVFLHGTNQTAHAWDLVSLNLAGEYNVLALDQRGHGDSEWNRGAHYGITDMAADAEAFLDTLGLDSPIVVGHSMGGMVTLALTHKLGTRLKAIVVVDIGPEVNERGTRMIRDFVGRNIEFEDLEEFLDRVEEYDPYRTREHMARTVRYNLLRRADGRYVTKNDRRRYASGSGEKGRRISGAPTLDELQQLELPILVVRGGESNVLTAEAAERFAGALANASLVTVPKCGHNVASQNTTGFLTALRPFLAEVSR